MRKIFNEAASELLKEASDVFCHHGCNDLTDEVENMIKSWPPTQKRFFIAMADKWNNGPMGLEEQDLHRIDDWVLMGVLSYILKHKPD